MSYLDHAELSVAQLEVLADPGSRSLVAAGAGSGKTRLLVACFVRALLDEGVSLDDIAAVTFTRKAGSELVDRIRCELDRCGHPELARSVDRAAIGTIHGLCSRLLRQQPLRAGIDPSFAILEEDVAGLVREEISKQVWDQVIEGASEGELEAMAARGDSLRTQAAALYVRLRGMGQESPQIYIEPGPGEPAARRALMEACVDAIAGTRISCRGGPALDEDLERLGNCLEWLEVVGGGNERPTVAATNGFFPSRKTKAAEPWLVPVREALICYRCALAEEELRPVVTVVNCLLALFHRDYAAYKESRGVLDFADLELRAAAMLADSGRGGPAVGVAPTTASAAFVSRMLVDEFQDTNEVQCAILDRMGAERVLMVGDERQSIYRFRGADVDVFRRRKQADDIGQHQLDINYRSRPQILDFINRLFSSEGFFAATTFAPLEPGRDLETHPPAGRGLLPKGTGSADTGAGDGQGRSNGGSWITEVLVADRPVPPEGQDEAPVFHEAEARAVAARARRLIDEEGFSQSDIVVLLPVLSNVSLFQEALVDQGIDVYVVRGKGYYSQDEVADVAALLRLLVNPHDDLSLVTVLRSPLVGVSDDLLYLVGRAAHGARARSLWEVLREGAVAGLASDDEQKVAAFMDRLNALRARVGRPGLSELIDDAVTACDYDLCLLAAPEGKRRFANIRKLMRMAADFEALEGPDLAGFVGLIGSLDELGDTEGNAPSLAEGEDVVRVMTVHQAKGLEFPAVFLAGLGSPGRNDVTEEFVIGHDGRIAALVKEKQDRYEECHPHWGPALEIIADEKRREEEEDVRLLYVAMTRAKDRLFVVGARPRGDKITGTPIGKIIAGLGLDSFPDSGSTIAMDDIAAAVISVGYSIGEGEDANDQDEQAVVRCPVTHAPAPTCFLRLEKPGAVSRQISFSALSAFRRCPRRFYLERVLGLGYLLGPAAGDADPDMAGAGDSTLDDVESDTGRDIGLLVHALLEQSDLSGGRPASQTLRERAEAQAVADGLRLSTDGFRRVADLVAAFWDSPLAGDPEIDSALREEAFFFVHGDMTVHGVMDLLCLGENRWRIVDYKSNFLGERTPTEVAETYELQAGVYCLAALKAGAPAVRMEFLFLARPEQPVIFEYTSENLGQLEALLDEALAGIRRGVFPPAHGGACAGCGVADLCGSMARL
jgi:ATP-dependent helicase/nuclease subunit A